MVRGRIAGVLSKPPVRLYRHVVVTLPRALTIASGNSPIDGSIPPPSRRTVGVPCPKHWTLSTRPSLTGITPSNAAWAGELADGVFSGSRLDATQDGAPA